MKFVIDCHESNLAEVVEIVASIVPSFGLYGFCNIPTEIDKQLKNSNYVYDVCVRGVQSILFDDLDRMIKHGSLSLCEAITIRQDHRHRIQFEIPEIAYVFVVGDNGLPSQKIMKFFEENTQIIITSDLRDLVDMIGKKI